MYHWLISLRERRMSRRAILVTLERAMERTAAGAAFLDERHPGWYRRIDPDRLELADGTCCVLGQLHGEFRLGLSRSSLINLSSAPQASLSPVRMGFQCVGGVSEALQDVDYEYLNAAWRSEICRRLHAEEHWSDGQGTGSPVEQEWVQADVLEPA